MNMNTFPLSFQQHLIFCIIAILFMVLQFVRQRYWYQLVIAAAIGCSLLIYVNESAGWFYGVGIAELLLMVTSMVLYIVQSRKLAKAEAEAEAASAEAEEAVGAEAPAAAETIEDTEKPVPAEDIPAEENI